MLLILVTEIHLNSEYGETLKRLSRNTDILHHSFIYRYCRLKRRILTTTVTECRNWIILKTQCIVDWLRRLSVKFAHIQSCTLNCTPNAWIYKYCMKPAKGIVSPSFKNGCSYLTRFFVLSVCFWSIASIDFFALQTIRNLINVFESLTGFMERLNDLDLANVYMRLCRSFRTGYAVDMHQPVGRQMYCLLYKVALGVPDRSWEETGSTADSGWNERRIYRLFTGYDTS